MRQDCFGYITSDQANVLWSQDLREELPHILIANGDALESLAHSDDAYRLILTAPCLSEVTKDRANFQFLELIALGVNLLLDLLRVKPPLSLLDNGLNDGIRLNESEQDGPYTHQVAEIRPRHQHSLLFLLLLQ